MCIIAYGVRSQSHPEVDKLRIIRYNSMLTGMLAKKLWSTSETFSYTALVVAAHYFGKRHVLALR